MKNDNKAWLGRITANFKIITVLLMSLSYSLDTKSQSLASHCTTTDSLYTTLKGVAGFAVGYHINTHLLPEKDSFWLPKPMIERVTEAQIAVFNCDSLQEWADLYSDTGRARRMKYFPVWSRAPNGPGNYRRTVLFDTGSIFYKNLIKDSIFSGDPLYDSIVKRYDVQFEWYPSFHVLRAYGFYNYRLLLDTLKQVSWIKDIVAEPQKIGDAGEFQLLFLFDKDTTYLRYAWSGGDCPLGCTKHKFWNYKVYPDCSVEYLGDSALLLDNPKQHSFLDTIYRTCQDSLILKVDGLALDTLYPNHTKLWSNGSKEDSIVVHSSGDYWFKLKRNQTYDQSYFSLTKVRMIQPPQLSFNADTLICEREEVWLDIINPNQIKTILTTPSNSWIYSNEFPFQIIDSGLYKLSAIYCGQVDTLNVKMITPPTIVGSDSINLCFSDTIVLNSNKAFSYLWSTGETSPSVKVNKEGWYTCTTRNERCHFRDSVRLIHYPRMLFSLPRDTSLAFNDTLIYVLPAAFKKIYWNDQDSGKSRLFISSLLGQGVHQFWASTWDSFGCHQSDTFLIKTLPNHLDYFPKEVLGIYPNPFTHEIFIGKNIMVKKYELYNAQGRLIRKGIAPLGRVKNLENLKPGSYFLRLIEDERSINFSLIKQN